MLYTQYAIHTVHCTHSTLYTQYAVHTVRCTHSTLYTQHTVHTLHCTHSTLYTQYAVHTVHCTHSIPVICFGHSCGLHQWGELQRMEISRYYKCCIRSQCTQLDNIKDWPLYMFAYSLTSFRRLNVRGFNCSLPCFEFMYIVNNILWYFNGVFTMYFYHTLPAKLTFNSIYSLYISTHCISLLTVYRYLLYIATHCISLLAVYRYSLYIATHSI